MNSKPAVLHLKIDRIGHILFVVDISDKYIHQLIKLTFYCFNHCGLFVA